jgi:hypothetical protein
MTRFNNPLRTLSAIAVAVALAVAGSAALAQGQGKGNKPPTEAGFSLSVPAIIAVGVGGFPLNCKDSPEWSVLTPPSKPPVYYDTACALTQDGTEVCVEAGYYFVQRDAAWQAPCTTVVDSVVSNAKGAWGDNLTGDAMLKVGSPIRVELVLWDNSGQSSGYQGYEVIKLEPAELDRLSAYGHRADDVTFEAVPKSLGAIVHDPEATLKIERRSDGAVVFEGPAGGEINATGKIVYGYNLRVAEAGAYRITYTLPNVLLDPCPPGFCISNVAYLDIEVVGGGGGGGGKGGGQGGGKPVKP